MTMNQGWSGQESNLHLQCSSQAVRPLHYRSKSLALPLTASHTRGALPVVGQLYVYLVPITSAALSWQRLSQSAFHLLTGRFRLAPIPRARSALVGWPCNRTGST
jgi:hypothetical protein